MVPVFTKTDKEKADALLYTALFNETERLKQCGSKKERQEIRKFILNGYSILAESIRQEMSCQDTFQEDMLQQPR